MTWLRLGMIYLCENKFNHNFQDCIDPLWSCDMDIESWISFSHYFLRCPLFDDKRIILLSLLSKINYKLIETNESSLTETLLVGNSLFCLIWKKTSLSLTHPLITFYPLKDSKNPCFNILITTIKYSYISNHSFTHSELFNLLYLYLDLVTFIFFVPPRHCWNFWCLAIVTFSLLFYICYLTARQPTLGHYRGDSFTHTMLSLCYSSFNPKVTWSLVTRLDSQARSST